MLPLKTQTELEIKKYINQMNEIYELFLVFMDNPDLAGDIDYNNLIYLLDSYCIEQNKELFNHFIDILINIANNHHRNAGFFNKIERILIQYKDLIKKTHTNIEIYEQFESNKRLLYFIIKNRILEIDNKVMQMIEAKIELNGIHYSNFFLHEIQKLDFDSDDYEILSHYIANEEEYEEKRQIGENDSYICSMIRNDMIEDFIKHVNQANISLSSTIKPSIFETNSFLVEKEPTLIEYAAFFGSIQIFKYLYMNNVKIDGSLWLYAIHSNNSDFIRNYIEAYHIEPTDKSYREVLIESIKCHHNEIANYIQENYFNENKTDEKTLKNQISFDELICQNAFKYQNYSFFPKEFNQNYSFFYFCKYNYTFIVDLLLKSHEEENNQKNISIQKAADDNQTEFIYYLLSKKQEITKEFFSANKNLQRIAIPSSIKTIGKDSFLECFSLTEILIPKTVTSIERAAFYRSLLREIIIPSSITSIEPCVFGQCQSLTEISIPSSVTSIKKYAFSNCNSLKLISIPSSVTSIESHAFEKCTSLIKITIPSSVTSIESHAFEECTSLIKITIPASVTSIKEYTFYKCHSLEQATILSPVISIEKSAFNECFALKQFVFPSNVISLGETVFYECKSLKKISLPSSITSIEKESFNMCLSLTQVLIPSSVTSIKSGVFYQCSSLSQISIPSSVNFIGSYALGLCSSLTHITIPSSITMINPGVFNGCTSLTQISIPLLVTVIRDYAFCGCTSLVKIEIPPSVTIIGRNAFQNCSSLAEINLPSSINRIDEYAFEGCSSLKEISIPSSVKEIGYYAFGSCLSLTKISIPSSLDIKLIGTRSNVQIIRF